MLKPILDTQAVSLKTLNTQHIMLWVLAALLPGVFVYAWFISPLVFFNIALAAVLAVVFEALALYWRGQAIHGGVQDGSIVVAAVLLALAVPPLLPFWQLAVGVFIMVMLGKQVYGGLGNNPFNPAMVGYTALLVSFPQTMTLWSAPDLLNQLTLGHLLNAKLSLDLLNPNLLIDWDGITRATPLEHLRTLKMQGLSVDQNLAQQQFISSGWVWTNLAFLLGGLLLLYRRIIQWHIPASVILSFALCSLLFSAQNVPWYLSVFSGALMLGAFFIATDPVTAASSNRGRLVFGAGIGALCFIIREFGGYPEGFAFAVLLMNLCVPLIDHIDMHWGTSA